MKTLVTNYTFSASARQVTLTNYPFLKLDQILLITNVTDNVIIYNFADPTAGGTLAGNVLTLLYNTTSMSDSDRLQIFIDDYTVPATEASLTAVQVRIDNTNGQILTLNTQLTGQLFTINQNVSSTNPRLSSIDTKLTTLITQTDQIEGYINDVESSLTSISNNTKYLNPEQFNQTITQLTSSVYIGEGRIFSIQGTSYAGYDQYLQINDAVEGTASRFTQLIKTNENFNIEFSKGFYGETLLIRNSLTPVVHTPGNNDIMMTVHWRGV